MTGHYFSDGQWLPLPREWMPMAEHDLRGLGSVVGMEDVLSADGRKTGAVVVKFRNADEQLAHMMLSGPQALALREWLWGWLL